MNSFPSQNPLLEMGEYKFQDLCRELLEQENNILNCNDYEERGVSQHGADLIAYLQDGISTVIGQCKCYKVFPPANFINTSNEFLDYLETNWKPFDVKKFILFLGCDILKANQLKAIQGERLRFYAHGIAYEVWDKKRILAKLRPYPHIVLTYFRSAPNYWLEEICKITGGAAAIQPPQTATNATLSVSFAQIGKITEIFSGKQSEELEVIKELHYEGRFQEVAEKLLKIRSSEEWNLLNDKVKAKILKMSAVSALSLDSDLEKAKELFNEALSQDPQGDHKTFRVTLEYQEKGAKAALDIIGEPNSTDELNQKIAFYLELNNHTQALKLLENLPDGITPDTETRRLYALTLFESGKVEEAWVKINQVEEEKPNREMVQIAKAIIGYYSCISPAVFPAHPLSWAMPVLWQLIKRDDESRTRLQNAEKTFERILATGNKRNEQKLIFESFRLACLANNDDRQDETLQFFRETIAENPSHPFLLAWAQVRGFDFDPAASRLALETKIDESLSSQSDIYIEEIIALLDIYLRANETKKGRQLLEQTHDRFKIVGGESVFSYWISRVAVIDNKYAEALRYARSEKDRSTGRQIQAMILRDKYFSQKPNKKAYKDFANYLEKCWYKTGDLKCLVELSYLFAENNQWKFISENCDKFIDAAATADAVRISAYALISNKQPTKCLKILETYRNRFPDYVLPTELDDLRIRCLTQLGSYSEAVSEAETLYMRHNSAQNLLILIDALLQKGDVAGVIYNAQKLLHLPDIEPKYILRVAKISALEDAELAKKLWRRAKGQILDNPELIRDALDIGFAIGLDDESRDLLARMSHYADQKDTPFTTFSFRETLQQMKKMADRRDQIYKQYGTGRLPLHFLAGEGSTTLATLIHELPRTNRKSINLRYCPKIFTRYGGRSMREGFFDVKPESRLYMDITAFLMANELNILDKIENMFAPIRVPASLPLALTAERQKLAGSHQLDQIITHRRVLEVLENNKFELFSRKNSLSPENAQTYKKEIKRIGASKVALIIKAQEEFAYVVKHLPMIDKSARPFLLPESLSSNVINCRVIADNLFHLGCLNQGALDASISKLGTDGKKISVTEIQIPLGTKLYLDDYMVNALEKAELLTITCEYYEVVADKQYIERIRAEIESFERDEKTSVWLQSAEKHLSEGFTRGIYTGISVEEKQAFESLDIPNNVDVEVVTELLQLAPQLNAVVWIDDRSVNAHSHVAGNIIVTVTDMLAALRLNEKISDDEYFNSLRLLRAGNYCYIPLTSEEILHQLRTAKIIDNKIVETEALSVLRRYTATCLLDEQYLQKTPQPKGSPNYWGELNFVLEMTGAVSDSIISVWKEDENLREARIRADWIFDNLYIGKHGARQFVTLP